MQQNTERGPLGMKEIYRCRECCLLPDYLHQNPIAASAVELTVKDLFPRARDFELSRAVQTAIGDGDDHFTTHNLPLKVSVGVLPSTWLRVSFAGAIVQVLAGGCVGRQYFQAGAGLTSYLFAVKM